MGQDLAMRSSRGGFAGGMIVFALIAEEAGACEEFAAGLRGGGECCYLDRPLRKGMLEIFCRTFQCLRISKHVAVTCHKISFDVWTRVVDEGVVQELKALLLRASAVLGILEFRYQS